MPALALGGSIDIGGGGSSVPAPPTGCTQTANGILIQKVQVADVSDTITILCENGQTYYAATNGQPYAGPIFPEGVGCTVTFYSPVNLSQITPNGTRNATWQGPPGPVVSASTNHAVLSIDSQNQGSLSGAQALLYTNLVDAIYVQHGTGNGSACVGPWSQCGHTIRPEGLGTSVFDPCVNLTSYAPNPPDCTGACEQPVADLISTQVNGHFFAGHVQTWPQPAQPPKVGPVVNLPVQFYVPDWSFNDTQQALRRWEVILIGPPDDLGRSRVFTYLVTVGLQGIDWDFGDGTGAHFADASGFGQNVFPPNGTSSVNHPYTRISDPNPYHVTVTETWGVRVDKYWIGGHSEMTNLERTFPVMSSADMAVGQVEPVPCSGIGCV
jgi:hypothetical protein